jgi:hypothetical protein
VWTVANATLQWKDLFVIVDNGELTIAEYEALESLVKVQAQAHLSGLGCLVIIPEGATPPSTEVRRHLQDMLRRLPMRRLAYVVEGNGFRAATARAAVLGLGVFQRNAYATKVVGALEPALSWLLDSSGRPTEVQAAIQSITTARGTP